MVGETAVCRIAVKDWFGDGGENGRLSNNSQGLIW